MRCDELDRLLDEYVDGTLSEVEAAAVARHLEGCEVCAKAEVSLRALLREAAALPGAEPSHDLWPGIERCIGGRPMTANDQPPVAFRRALPARALLAVAAMLLVAAGAVVVGVAIGRRTATGVASEEPGRPVTILAASSDVRSAHDEFARARAQLRAALQARRASFSPAAYAVIERNLAVIDEAARQLEKALATSPDNPGLEQLLLATYRQEIDMLQQVTQSPTRG